MSLKYGLPEYVVGRPCQVLISGYSYRAVIVRDNGDTITATVDGKTVEVPKTNTFASSYYWVEVK
ncbi:hypothetical protein phiAS5_ORF0079 [Aeromonas phage phiAS5]|uniref:Uncharacterized protein n=1 Tax=Aeromonas phage phiAS5 TaxID=879630 RepID=E1A2H6_9CAUD|nr:hypothetical protein phiAS5_ORF0079 [Aeromonas phage phiAS5]ADM79922.1 hypothetical protein phiAS5_ORF0079 [Aeromonas phage phiAS5]BES53306.1 hypothetical protein [Aeromonas phage phiWae14]